MAKQSREHWFVCQQDFVSRERQDKAMRQATQITIEHIVLASDRSYEQVIEALEAQLGLREDWDKIARALITTNPSWEQAVQIVEQQLGTSGFTILSKIEPGTLLRLSGKPTGAASMQSELLHRYQQASDVTKMTCGPALCSTTCLLSSRCASRWTSQGI
jgi:hypothetical protein